MHLASSHDTFFSLQSRHTEVIAIFHTRVQGFGVPKSRVPPEPPDTLDAFVLPLRSSYMESNCTSPVLLQIAKLVICTHHKHASRADEREAPLHASAAGATFEAVPSESGEVLKPRICSPIAMILCELLFGVPHFSHGSKQRGITWVHGALSTEW